MTRTGSLLLKVTNHITIIAFLLFFSGCYQPQKDFYSFNGENAVEMRSPNGQIKLFFEAFPQRGILYSVHFKGKNILAPSRLGLLNEQNKPFLSQPEIEKIVGNTYRERKAGKPGNDADYNELAIYLRSKELPDLRIKLLFRLYSNNVMAFRYILLSGLAESIRINGELTQFVLPKGRQSDFYNGMKGKNRLPINTHIDFPVWFSARNIWARITDSEAIPSTSLRRTADYTLDVVNGSGTVINYYPYPFPWREITIADSMVKIRRTAIPNSLN